MVTEDGIYTVSNLEHPEKAYVGMVVTPLGIAMDVNRVQFANELLPMAVSVDGKLIAVRLPQLLNDICPSVVTPSGKTTEERPLALLKAKLPTATADDGNAVSHFFSVPP